MTPEPPAQLENEIRVFGPPGTGKTTWMAGSVRATARSRMSSKIVVASFTRSAAAEIAGRGLPIPREQVGTLHALAYRAIGHPQVAEERMSEWNAKYPALAMTPGFKDMGDNGVEFRGSTDGDELLSRLDTMRAKQTPMHLWPVQVQQFAKRWTAWKQEAEVVDFTDMIELALENTEVAPGEPTVGYFDEFQDFTPLEINLVRHWGRRMEKVIVAGDDDQCQPAGTMVLTTEGEVPIQDLDPERHRLVSMDLLGGSEIRRRGYEFSVASREYAGPMVHVVWSKYEWPDHNPHTAYTPDHRCIAKWRNDVDLKVVYLMRRGADWRLGTTDLIRYRMAKPVFGPGQRCRQEEADEVWVLSAHERTVDALLEESRLSVTYGIPQTVFKASSTAASQEELDLHHSRLRGVTRPAECLAQFGMSIDHPIWTAGEQTKFGAHSILRIRACNLIEGAMLIALDVGASKPEWSRFRRFDTTNRCQVFSLDVEPYHTYVADGVVTRNCIYSFKGATPDAFLDPPVPDEQKRVLAQSYRIPASVHRVAERWIRRLQRREEKEYLPRDEEGLVRYEQGYTYENPEYLLRDVVKQVDAGREVMVIATCAYMLDPFKYAMRSEGLPFWNPGRLSRADWNPLRSKRGTVSGAERLLAYMVMDEELMGEASRLWTGGDVKRWSQVVRKAAFRRGAGAAIERLPDRELKFEEVAALFDDQSQLEEAATPSIEWFQRNLLAGDRQRMEYPIMVARKRGPLALAEDPKVVLGTIHSQKGSQAQIVYLMPDLSLAGAREWDSRATRDAIVRQMYVGMTRPSEELVVCGPSSPYCVDPTILLRKS